MWPFSAFSRRTHPEREHHDLASRVDALTERTKALEESENLRQLRAQRIEAEMIDILDRLESKAKRIASAARRREKAAGQMEEQETDEQESLHLGTAPAAQQKDQLRALASSRGLI